MADFILVIHFLFVIAVIFGGFIVYQKPLLAWLHLPMVVWAMLVNIMGWVCPLTPLENFYRKAAGQQGYQTGFLEHYLMPLIYPEALSYQSGALLGILVFLWNLLIYAFLVQKLRSRK